jgi:hypothetical protein
MSAALPSSTPPGGQPSLLKAQSTMSSGSSPSFGSAADAFGSQQNDKQPEEKESFASSMCRGALQLGGGLAGSIVLAKKGYVSLTAQILGGFAIGGVIGALYSMVHQKMTTGKIDGKQLAKDSALGLIGI